MPYCFYKDCKYGFVGEQEIRTVRLLACHNAHHLYQSIGFNGMDERVLHI
ncbi:hypothetical protein Back11_19380 [Paenibacillus baekrokdamisoli]|uniref:Uncharacterized protein n=1 Tax=Paenibacillus baekrokdamisoli TaxID=1712516 RepID=A0A3G9J6X4_9BACL|nr:hypothetical protein Back11_19380 [Paenibacillus baekrokdamisoli]